MDICSREEQTSMECAEFGEIQHVSCYWYSIPDILTTSLHLETTHLTLPALVLVKVRYNTSADYQRAQALHPSRQTVCLDVMV